MVSDHEDGLETDTFATDRRRRDLRRGSQVADSPDIALSEADLVVKQRDGGV